MEAREAVEVFLSATRRRRAKGTAATYAVPLGEFASWAADRRLGEITTADLELGYLGGWADAFERRHGRPPSANTQRGRIVALKAMYRWADRLDLVRDAEGRPTRDPAARLESISQPRQLRAWLTPAEVEAIADASRSEFGRMLVTLLALSGLRVSEAINLTWADLDFDLALLYVNRGKTASAARAIHMSAELRGHLAHWRAYQTTRGVYRPTAPVLATRSGRAVSRQQCQITLANLGRKAQLSKRVSPHTLRRSFATMLISDGMAMHEVSRCLGHASVAVTERSYAHVAASDVNEALRRVLG